MGNLLLEPQWKPFMEFCFSFPTSELVDALYFGHIGLCLKSPGVQEL